MSNLPPQTPEPLPDLLRSIADQAQTFARAEIEILKIESKSVATKAAVALVVLTCSGLLLALGISLAVAAVALTRGATPAVALVVAASVNVVIAGVSTAWAIAWGRKRMAEPAPATQATKLPQHGGAVS